MMALLAGGGTLAAAGIWLMLRETASGEPLKFALGPVQVQSASIGFSVFLAGASAFTAPLVAPESTEELVDTIMEMAGGGLAEVGPTQHRANGGLPIGLVPKDAEPDNDTRAGAATVRAGDLAGGFHDGENIDWFRLDVSDYAGRRIVVELTERATDCFAHFYDGAQTYMGLVDLQAARNVFELDVNDNESFWLQLSCTRDGIDDPYHLTFLPVPQVPEELGTDS